MNLSRLLAAILALFIAVSPAAAQWQTPNHSVPVGRGAGVTGFGSAAPGAAGVPLVSNGPAADPTFRLLPPAGGGTGADNSVNTTGDVLASNGTNGSFVRSALATLINSACSVTPSSCAAIFGYVSPLWYGAVCDGTTNDTTALQTALTAAAGKALLIPPATCMVNAHLNIASDTVVKGSGREVSIVKQTGQDFIFGLANVNNVAIENVGLLGTRTYTSWNVSRVGAISISATDNANLTFRNLKLSGFNATYWIYGQQGGIVNGVVFDNVWISSVAADVPTDPDPGSNTSYGITLFSGTGGARWENTSIRNIRVDGDGLCFGVILYSNHYKWSITNNSFLNIGGTNPNGHCTNALGATNAYAVAIYDLNSDGNPPSDGIIAGNYILHPIASGIYFAGDGVTALRTRNSVKTWVTGNLVVSQSATDLLLPRAAVAINDSTDIAVIGNEFYNNATCVSVNAVNAGEVSILSNHCSSSAGGSVGMQMNAGNQAANTDVRVIRGNYINVLGTAIAAFSTSGLRLSTLDISANNIVAASNGINLSNQFISGVATISGNTFSGGGTLANFSGVTGAVMLSGNPGLSFTAAALPAAANGSAVFVSDGTPASACTGGSTGSTAFRQNGAWKCF